IPSIGSISELDPPRAVSTPSPALCSGSLGTCLRWASTSTLRAGVSRSWIWTGAALTRCWRSRQKLKSLETGHAHLLCYDRPHDSNHCSDAKPRPNVLHAAVLSENHIRTY